MEPTGAAEWMVRSGGAHYLVHYDPAEGIDRARCTCTWYLRHLSRRGPCKHVLDVQIEGRA